MRRACGGGKGGREGGWEAEGSDVPTEGKRRIGREGSLGQRSRDGEGREGHRRDAQVENFGVGDDKTDMAFFAVFDGHGGSACADYLRDNLHNFVVQNE